MWIIQSLSQITPENSGIFYNNLKQLLQFIEYLNFKIIKILFRKLAKILKKYIIHI